MLFLRAIPLSCCICLLLVGCETTEETATQSEAAPVTATRLGTPPVPDTEKAELPVMPVGQRDDLTDPRLLAAAQRVGATPQVTADGQAVAAPQPRNDLTDPRMLAAAKAAGISLPPQSNESVELEPVEVTEEEAPVVQPKPAEVTAITSPLPQPVIEPKESIEKPIPAPVKQTVVEQAKPVVAVPTEPVTTKPTPPTIAYPKTTGSNPKMAAYYEKELQREDLDEVLREYYERKLAESKSTH